MSASEQLRYMAYKKYGKDPGTMSVQYLVDCYPLNLLAHCEDGVKGCCGGLPAMADMWLEINGGLPTQADYGLPMSDKHPRTAYDCKMGVKKTVRPTAGFQTFSTELDIANAFCLKGVVSIGIDAHAGFMHYTGGILDAAACSSGQINHAVAYVGVDKTFNDGEPVHIILNSWGPDWGVAVKRPYAAWGKRGHILFEYGKDVCSMTALATQPVDVKLM